MHRRALAESVEVADGRARAVHYVQRAETKDEMRRGARSVPRRLDADAVVAAVPWSALPALVPEEFRAEAPFSDAGRLRGSPIVSIELWLDRVVLDRPMAGLRETEVEWVFDKGRLYGREGAPQHLAFIVSAAVRATVRPNAELAAIAEAALRRYFAKEMAEARVVRSLVLREPEATFVCDPAAEEIRPGPETPIRGLLLAGDWTNTGLPATIEGAVRSGRVAADRLAGP